jgi:hypothetical protein
MKYVQNRSIFGELLAGDGLAQSIGELELGKNIALMDGSPEVKSFLDLSSGDIDGVLGGLRGILLEVGEDLLEFGLEAHFGG